MDPQIQSTSQPRVVTGIPQENNVNKILISIVGILAVVTLIVGGFYFLTSKQTKQQAVTVPNQPPTIQPSQIPSIQPDEFAGWKAYESSKGDFSFKYPGGLFTVDTQDDYLRFYNTQANAVAHNSEDLVLNIGVGVGDKNNFRSLQQRLDQNDLAIRTYNDINSRQWKISGPISISAAADLLAQHISDNKGVEISIQAGFQGFGTYLKSQSIINDLTEYMRDESIFLKQHEDLSNKILSTFKFTTNQQNSITQGKPAIVQRSNTVSSIKYTLPPNWSADVTNNVLVLTREGGGYIDISSFYYDGKTGRREFFAPPSSTFLGIVMSRENIHKYKLEI